MFGAKIDNSLKRILFLIVMIVISTHSVLAETKSINATNDKIRKILSDTASQFGWNVGSIVKYKSFGQQLESSISFTRFDSNRIEGELRIPVPQYRRDRDEPTVPYILISISHESWKGEASYYYKKKRDGKSFYNDGHKPRVFNLFNIKALEDSGGWTGSVIGDASIYWHDGPFIFTISGPPNYPSYENIAKALYQNAKKHGLSSQSNNSAVLIDSDKDGVSNSKDKCPNTKTGVSVDANGCPKKDILISIRPDHFSKVGETVQIKVRLVGGKSQSFFNMPISLSGKNIIESKKTNNSGIVYFLIRHTDEKRTVYEYIVKSGSLTKKIRIPVVSFFANLENNSITGKPYKGVVADGKSYIEINIDTSSLGNGFLHIKQPKQGYVDCAKVKSPCKRIPVSGSQIMVRFYPPSYLKTEELSEKIPFTEEASLATNGAKGGGTVYFKNGQPWVAHIPINFVFEDTKGKTMQFSADVLVAHPPIMLVHGFTGDRTTWSKLQAWLGRKRFDGIIDEYYAGNQSIYDQSEALMHNIEREVARYRAFGLKCARVDVVAHSMGGLIARRYLKGFFPYKGDIRKLIMVGTPNHGVGYLDYSTGVFISDYLKKHQLAATQLYSKSAFMKALNKGEAMGRNLRESVQYGNIYGITTDYVVPMSSAFLNGVRERTFTDVKHSPAIPLPGISITESTKVFKQIQRWLNNDIPKARLRNVRLQLVRSEGYVYKHEYIIKNKKIWDKYTEVREFPNLIKPWEDVGTGENSKAWIRLTISGHNWGSVSLDKNSLVEFGFVSPKSVTIRVRKGSVRFSSAKRQGGGHFTVVVVPKKSGKWFTFHPNAKVIGLDTDFVVTVEQEGITRVEMLSGRAKVEGSSENSFKSQIISKGETVKISETGKISSSPGSQVKWWTNSHYTDSTGENSSEEKEMSLRSILCASADAYVYAYNYRNWNRSNRGKYDQLVAGWHPIGGESRAYIKFDLPHIAPAKIDKAVLKLFHFQTKLGNGIDLGIYRVTSPWKEGTDNYHSGRTEKTAAPGELSWVQQPSIDATPIAIFNPGSRLYDWTEVDITPLVKKWLSGSPNYGLVIRPLNHRKGSIYYFAARERNFNLDPPKGKSKVPELILSGETVPLSNELESSLRGVWRWTCCGGRYSGTFRVSTVGANGRFSGRFGNLVDDGKSPFSGRMTGNRVLFTRTILVNGKKVGEQEWRAKIVFSQGQWRMIDGDWTGYARSSGNGGFSAIKVSQQPQSSGINGPSDITVYNGKALSICGKWKWFNGETIDIYPNGTVLSSGGNHGKWKVVQNTSGVIYVIDWNNGWAIDKLRLKNDTLDGYNHEGTHVWGKRIVDSSTTPSALPLAGAGKTQKGLVSGTYRVTQGHWKSTWRIRIVNGRITGTSKWSCCPHHRIDPLKGKIEGNLVVIERDCSGQGWNGYCKQIFRGQLKNNRIEGTCSGTGLNVAKIWVLYLDNLDN